MKPIAFVDDYTIYKCLDETKENLFLASKKDYNIPVVIKTYPYTYSMKPNYIQERNHLLKLEHPNIIKLKEFKDSTIICDQNTINKVSYLVMEYIALGDLCDHLQTKGAFPEILARMLFHQIIDSVSYLHKSGSAHMDLKAENIMLDENFNIKLIDFDQSLNFGTRKFASRGTPSYRCPEVIKGISDCLNACDVYSLGVILFLLLNGHHPYLEVTNESNCARYDQYYQLLRNNPVEFWRQHAMIKESPNLYSNGFKELIMSMLCLNPSERATIEDIKDSEWFKGPVYEREEYEREMRKYLKLI